MKTFIARIRTEKQFWLDLSRQLTRLGYTVKWELAGYEVSRQKVWNRIDACHHNGIPAYYGLTVTVGRIGNHDLKLCLEMQDDLKIGLRFKEGFPYWTEDEIENWGDLTFRLDHQGSWSFDAPGWFATQKLPVKLNFRDKNNPAALDLEYYAEDSLVKLMIQEEISSRLYHVKSVVYSQPSRKVWNL